MHRKISDLKLEEAAIMRLAKGKVLEAPKSHSIFNPNHHRIGTELSLQEVMREGQEHTLRRYSQTILTPPPSLFRVNQLTPKTPVTPLGNTHLNPIYIPENKPTKKKKCCSIM
jgi:hypothetical protein